MNALMAFTAPYQGDFKRKCVSPIKNKNGQILQSARLLYLLLLYPLLGE